MLEKEELQRETLTEVVLQVVWDENENYDFSCSKHCIDWCRSFAAFVQWPDTDQNDLRDI